MFRNMTCHQLALRLRWLGLLSVLLLCLLPAAKPVSERLTTIESSAWADLFEADGSVCPECSGHALDLPLVEDMESRCDLTDSQLTVTMAPRCSVHATSPLHAHFIRPPPLYHS